MCLLSQSTSKHVCDIRTRQVSAVGRFFERASNVGRELLGGQTRKAHAPSVQSMPTEKIIVTQKITQRMQVTHPGRSRIVYRAVKACARAGRPRAMTSLCRCQRQSKTGSIRPSSSSTSYFPATFPRRHVALRPNMHWAYDLRPPTNYEIADIFDGNPVVPTSVQCSGRSFLNASSKGIRQREAPTMSHRI